MNIINYFFFNKLNKSCFNLMIVSIGIGMLENLEPATMLEKSWNDPMSSKELCESDNDGTFEGQMCTAFTGRGYLWIIRL
jgi:hypothetical protein